MLNFAGAVARQPAIRFPGIVVTPLVTTEDSEGVVTIIESRFEPGAGTPTQIAHREAMMSYVVEGTFEFRVGDDRREFGPGGFVKIPTGVVYSFKNVGDSTGVVVGTSTPAGHEKFLKAISDLMQDEEIDPIRLRFICDQYGVEMVD